MLNLKQLCHASRLKQFLGAISKHIKVSFYDKISPHTRVQVIRVHASKVHTLGFQNKSSTINISVLQAQIE
jgi:hypothetical protein